MTRVSISAWHRVAILERATNRGHSHGPSTLLDKHPRARRRPIRSVLVGLTRGAKGPRRRSRRWHPTATINKRVFVSTYHERTCSSNLSPDHPHPGSRWHRALSPPDASQDALAEAEAQGHAALVDARAKAERVQVRDPGVRGFGERPAPAVPTCLGPTSGAVSSLFLALSRL